MTGFMDLPFELRAEIIYLTVVRLEPIVFTTNGGCRRDGQSTLAMVARQVRSECLEIFYRYNALAFWSLRDAMNHIARLSPDIRREIRDLRICDLTGVGGGSSWN